jgi:hypothetical protein
MNLKVVEISTDENLLIALKKHAEHKPTHDEIREQKVSFIYGALKLDSNITKEQVKKVLVNQEG